jgi:hypothetical protein
MLSDNNLPTKPDSQTNKPLDLSKFAITAISLTGALFFNIKAAEAQLGPVNVDPFSGKVIIDFQKADPEPTNEDIRNFPYQNKVDQALEQLRQQRLENQKRNPNSDPRREDRDSQKRKSVKPFFLPADDEKLQPTTVFSQS